MALCLVPLYGVISLKEKNVEIFNRYDSTNTAGVSYFKGLLIPSI